MPMYQHKTLYIFAILCVAEFSAKGGITKLKRDDPYFLSFHKWQHDARNYVNFNYVEI